MVVEVAMKKIKKKVILKTETVKDMERKILSVEYEHRSTTDKYWCLLFLLIFTIWVSSWICARCQLKPNTNFDRDNNNTASNETTEIAPFSLWGKSWLFDAITCNLVFLNAHYENSGSIVIWTNLLFCALLFYYSLSSMPNTDTFHSQLTIACVLYITYRLYFTLIFFPPGGHAFLVQSCHEKLFSWIIPDAIFIIIWYTKKSYTNHRQLNGELDEMRYFRKAYWNLIVYVTYPTGMWLFLFVYTEDIVSKLGWNNALTYSIVGGSCYVGLTFYYFWLMVVSCAADVDSNILDFDNKYWISGEYIFAFARIARYHFGTACYHATLILPRIETFLIMNEPEFKREKKLSNFTRRFCIAQSQIHDFSLISTAIGGTRHSESLREILRQYATSISPKFERFRGFSQISRSLTALLLSTNGLITIFLWMHGLNDPNLSFTTWIFYVHLMLVFHLIMKVCDAVLNATFLHI